MRFAEIDMNATPETEATAGPARFPLDESIKLFRAFDAAADAESARQAPADFAESRTRLAALIDRLPQRRVIENANAERWLDRTMRTAVMRMELEAESSDYTAAQKTEVAEILETLGDTDTTIAAADRERLEMRLEELARETRPGGKSGSGDAVNPKIVRDAHNHVLWHIRRASGIGGSEAGTVWKHFKGQKGTFSDAHNLALEKLLIMSPRPSTDQMARGIRAEPWIQKMYHEKHGVKSAQADLDKLRNYRWSKRPAAIGTPDDIVVHTLGEFAGKKRCLDYKAPSANVMEEYERNGVSEDYVCQVHHYGMLQLASGSRFDLMSIEAFDPRTFKIVSFEVPFDKELARAISDSSDRLWHEFIMNGIIPEAPKPDDLAVDDPALINLAAQAAMLKKLGDEIGKRQKELLERISMVGSAWHDKSTGKMDLMVASFNRKRSWNEEGIRDLAEASDVDIQPFMVPDKKGKLDADQAAAILKEVYTAASTPGANIGEILERLADEGLPVEEKLDMDALAEHLEERGVDVTGVMEVKESFLMSRKTKGPEFERMTVLNAWVGDLVAGISDMAVSEAPRIVLGEEALVEEPEYDPDEDGAYEPG